MRSLISIEELKSSTILNKNIDDKYLLSAIETAQQVHLQQLIGTALLEKLEAGVGDSGDWTGSDAEYILVTKYIQPFLKKRVVADIIMAINWKIRNEGVLQATSDTNLYLPSRADTLYVRDSIEQESNFFAERMTRYLCENKDSFPEYCQEGLFNANPRAKNTIIYME